MIRWLKRHALPLALTIAVHLLLFLCLHLARRGPPLATPAGAQSAMFVLLEPASIRPAAIGRAARHAPAPTAPPAPPAPATSTRAPDQVPAAPAADTPAPRPASAADILARARRDAGQIDHQLRGATPPMPAVRPDSAQSRFERGMEAAWIDRSNTMVVDHYTSADGVIITRVTRGGGSGCYMSGTVNFVPGILHDSSRPQKVSCPPPGSGWSSN